MSNSILIHDVAKAIVRERLQDAAHQALIAQLPAADRPTPLGHLAMLVRQSVGGGLRGLTVRLDPSLDCQPVNAGVASSSR
jgi:hypothetical protein